MPVSYERRVSNPKRRYTTKNYAPKQVLKTLIMIVVFGSGEEMAMERVIAGVAGHTYTRTTLTAIRTVNSQRCAPKRAEVKPG